MTTCTIEVSGRDDDSLSVRILVRGLTAAGADLRFILTRPDADNDPVLGPDGWQAEEASFEPVATDNVGGDVVLTIGAEICRYLQPGQYTLAIPAAGSSGTLDWPDFPALPPDALETTVPDLTPRRFGRAVLADTAPQPPYAEYLESDALELDLEAPDEPPDPPAAGLPRPRNRRVLALAGLAIALAAACSAYFVFQPPPPPVPAPAAVAAALCLADVAERDGIVTVGMVDAGRGGQRLKLTVDGIVYAATFGSSGVLQVRAPLFHPFAEVTWADSNGTQCRKPVTFTGFATAYRAALVWQDSADLALHVGESGAKPGDPAHYVSALRPNRDLSAGDGEMLTFGEQAAGASRVQLYRVPLDRQPIVDPPSFFVEFVSRGNPAAEPYCGTSPEAQPAIRLLLVANGHPPVVGLTDLPVTLEPVACGHYVPRQELVPGYYRPVSFR
jgi:hypothetical protein